MTVCVDANAWIYFFDANLPEHGAARPAVVEVLRDRRVFTTTVLQMEVVHYLVRQLRDPWPRVETFLNLEDVRAAALERTDVHAAAVILRNHRDTGIGGRDATVVASMDRHGVTELLTHDAALKRLGTHLDWLDVTDPVESKE